MKKLIIAFGAMLALSFTACHTGSQDDGQTTDQPGDTIQQDTIQEVTGLAVDGAKNSIALLVGDDTLSYEYPDLDADHRDAWVIGDSVTVRFYATERGDSVVTDVIKSDAS